MSQPRRGKKAPRHCRSGTAAPLRCAHARRRRRPLDLRRGGRPRRRHPGAVPARRTGQRRAARHRALFDPNRFRALLLDQRGSRPQPSAPVARGQHDAASRRRPRAHPRAFRYRALVPRRRLVGLDARARLRRAHPAPRAGARAARGLPRHARGGRTGPSSTVRRFSAPISTPISSAICPSPSAPIRSPPTLPASPIPIRRCRAAPRASGTPTSAALGADAGQAAARRRAADGGPPAADADHGSALHPQRLLPRAGPAPARSREAQGHPRPHRAGPLRSLVPAQERLCAAPRRGPTAVWRSSKVPATT